MNVYPLLQKMIENEASDLFLTVGIPPSIKVHGKIFALSEEMWNLEQIFMTVYQLMNDNQKKEFDRTHECNFAFEAPNIGRFRISAFISRGLPGCVIRYINAKVPTIDELHLPYVMKSLAMQKRGLIIMVGSTGVGKTSTLAALLGYRNSKSKGHIVTIEDPIEYIHTHKQSIVTQREVGVDTESFEIALKNAMRQAPDMIQIGEIRDKATMQYAMNFAETGHLCLATLHANNTVQAMERISHFYSKSRREQLWMELALNLKAIIAQQLLPHVDGNSRVPVVEVMINTPIISECIRKGEIHLIRDYMMRKNEEGMQTFDQGLFKLYQEGQISVQDALAHADSANNLRLMIKLQSHTLEEHDPKINTVNRNRGWTLAEKDRDPPP